MLNVGGLSWNFSVVVHVLSLPLSLSFSPLFSRSLYVFLILSLTFLCGPFIPLVYHCCVVSSVGRMIVMLAVVLCWRCFGLLHSLALPCLALPALLAVRFTH